MSCHAAPGSSTQTVVGLLIPAASKIISIRELSQRELPEAALLRTHSRDPSTCAHPAKRDSRGAQGDNTEKISLDCTDTRTDAGGDACRISSHERSFSATLRAGDSPAAGD